MCMASKKSRRVTYDCDGPRKQVHEPVERLARGKRPDGAVPFTGARTVCAEIGMAAFRGG